MLRPSFKVVSGVVTILVLLAFFSRLIEPIVPPPPQNRLGNERGAYLAAGARQQIDWRPLRSDAFTEARRRDMPILLVVGAPWSRYAADMDSGVFSDNSVQNFLARNFICVRVDSLETPEWRNAYLPFSRGQAGTLILPGFAAWALDSTGAMYDYFGRSSREQGAESTTFMSFLLGARDKFDRLDQREIGTSRGGAQQNADRQVIDSVQEALPDFDAYAQRLAASADPKNGGFPTGGMQFLRPNAWRFMLLSGHVDAFRRTSDRPFLSPIVDLLDGGFFVSSDTPNWTAIDVGKVATANADMLRTLVVAEAVTGDRFYRWLGERTFDSLVGEFRQNDSVMGMRLSDSGAMGRSVHSSYSPRRLRELLPNVDNRSWAWQNLGLRTESNVQMLPYLTSRQLPFVQAETFQWVMEQLRKTTSKKPEFAGSQLLDVNGFVIARLLEAARAWADPGRMKQAADLYANLDLYRATNDVVHSLVPDGGVQASLADYLAYADAALAGYLSTGRSQDLNNGRDVLLRGLYLYRGRRLGVVRAGTAPPGVSANGCESPEVLDDITESLTAQLIRLCNAYAALYLTSDPASAHEFTTTANSATNLFAAIMQDLGPPAAGYFCAAARVMDSAYVFTTGPTSAAMADTLSSKLPTRIVAPAIGAIRPDLQARGPGVYIVRGAAVDGPLTLDAASSKLSPVLELKLQSR